MVGSQGANRTALFLLVGVFALLLLSYPVESFAAKGGNGGGGNGGGGNGGGGNGGGGNGGGGNGGDTTSPKADITYSQSGPYRAGATFTITATFDENIKGATIPKIAFSGVTDTTPVEMTKVSATVYTFEYTVDFNRTVTVSISLSGATDTAGNEIQSTPNSGGTFEVVKNSSNKPTPPKLSSSSITSTGGADGGFGGILQSSEYDKGIVKSGNTVSLRFDLDENFGDYYTFVLYLGELNNKESMGVDHSLQVIYHNGQYTISDKEELFSGVNVIETEFDGKTILFFDLETDKAFGDMDVGITAWNKHHQMVRELNQNVFSISPIVKPAEPGSFELLGTLSDEYVSGVYDVKTDLAKDFEGFLFVDGISTDFVFDESDWNQSLDTLYQKWNSKEISDLELIQLQFELISQKKAFVDGDEQFILLENMQEWQTEFLYDYVSENPLNSQALLSESFEIISQMI